jgi:hypothetical protein
VTLSKSLDALTGLGVGVDVALGVAGGVLLGVDALADGEAEGDAVFSSSPQAASSSEALSPRAATALAGKKRTGKPYPDT